MAMTKYAIGYARVSTVSQGVSSKATQETLIRKNATAMGYNLVKVVSSAYGKDNLQILVDAIDELDDLTHCGVCDHF
jgi:DNA invertase Pin-like site-specific DNA recombinase